MPILTDRAAPRTAAGTPYGRGRRNPDEGERVVLALLGGMEELLGREVPNYAVRGVE
ncbi:hypothetical protein ACFYRY_18165 [Streptomyces sp. NPDC005263]|uniref:hypothetical protein n=1 Tax=Streptomyces sp. NPDC005263 TaxID=3364711 RepID=UPI00367548AB